MSSTWLTDQTLTYATTAPSKSIFSQQLEPFSIKPSSPTLEFVYFVIS